MKKNFYTELAYAVGILLLAFGTAMMQRSEFGLSMIIAPAYILHLKISEFLPFFSFGMACYTFEAVLLIIIILIRHRAKLSYLFSFVTALIYGFTLDGMVWLVGFLPCDGVVLRILFFVVGILFCSWGLAFMFKTYIPQEAYEVFVLEISDMTGKNLVMVKTVYDLCSLVLAVVLSFAFFGFGNFNGVNFGTLVSAFANAPLIGLFSKLNDRFFGFVDGIPRLKAFLSK